MTKKYTYMARTKLGNFKLTASENGLISIDFPKQKPSSQSADIPHQIKRNCAVAEKWLNEYFRSSVRKSKMPQIDSKNWSESRRKMSRELMKVKSGSTHSYQQLARFCGIPKGSRAIGQLLGSNPLPIMIPCHRILRSDGTLGGFSGGLSWKKRLLRHERSLK